MTTFLRNRNRKRAPRFVPVVVQLTNHWRLVDGVAYRDCAVRMADGRVRVLGVRDDLLAAA